MARKHLNAVRKASAAIDTARARLAELMLEAQESGETVTDIADAAGLGRSRVHELLRQARRRREE